MGRRRLPSSRVCDWTCSFFSSAPCPLPYGWSLSLFPPPRFDSLSFVCVSFTDHPSHSTLLWFPKGFPHIPQDVLFYLSAEEQVSRILPFSFTSTRWPSPQKLCGPPPPGLTSFLLFLPTAPGGGTPWQKWRRHFLVPFLQPLCGCPDMRSFFPLAAFNFVLRSLFLFS